SHICNSEMRTRPSRRPAKQRSSLVCAIQSSSTSGAPRRLTGKRCCDCEMVKPIAPFGGNADRAGGRADRCPAPWGERGGHLCQWPFGLASGGLSGFLGEAIGQPEFPYYNSIQTRTNTCVWRN